ncbi:hypothetical protein PsYK624_152710 [Phanerochaete sordida]|uniref:Uncharacterized protein n=1 Tax=Phanerochaete sordida TaxID=48140 RepID=A0A9P3GNH9_9APHY|nr:hypothetical protein PsYK624_152710 [Phanerochaete sordida]
MSGPSLPIAVKPTSGPWHLRPPARAPGHVRSSASASGPEARATATRRAARNWLGPGAFTRPADDARDPPVHTHPVSLLCTHTRYLHTRYRRSPYVTA